MVEPIGFGYVDYAVILGSMLVCVFIPFFTRKKPKQDSEFIYGADHGAVDEYLLGGRKMSVIPVAFSITATMLSANSMTGNTGEIFINGIQFLLMTFGFIIGQFLVAKWIVPVLHKITITSIYEYIELRFDASLRMMFSLVFLFINLILNGVFLYAPAISFTTISGLPYWITTSVTGIICTLYCIAGGLKAVIWADVFQTLLIFLSMIMITVQGVIDGGGVVAIFKTTFEGRLDEHFTLLEDFTKRYSVWAIIMWGIVSCLYGSVSSQAGAQRLISVRNTSQAQKSLVLSTILLMLFNVLIVFAAVAIFAKFTNCDPLQRPFETGVYMPDQLLIYATGIMLGHIPGLLGIAMAGLISAALSTISSLINAFAACTLEDYLKPYCPRNWTDSDQKNLIWCKVLTAIFGILSIAFSLAIPHLGGIIRVLFAIIGALSGPFTGTLFLAFFFPKANANACKIAIVATLVFSLWWSIGALMHPMKTTGVVHSTKGCPVVEHPFYSNPFNPANDNFTSNFTAMPDTPEAFKSAPVNVTDDMNLNNTMASAPQPENSDDDVFVLYKISVMWIQPVSTGITWVIAIALSYAFGMSKELDPNLLSPLVVPRKPVKVRRQTRDDIIRYGEDMRLSTIKA